MPQEDSNNIIRVTEVDSNRLNKLENDLQGLRQEGAIRDIKLDSLKQSNDRLEHDVRGNGKEGLLQQVNRIELIVDQTQQSIDALPKTIEEKIELAITRFGMQINTGKMKTIAREEADKREQEERDAPGSWGEFRKQWLFPIVMLVVGALVSAALTYIIVTP